MPKLSISRDEWLQAAMYGNLDQLDRWLKSGALDVRYDPVQVGVSGGQGRAKIFDVCSTDKKNALYVALSSQQVDYALRLLEIGKFPSTKTIEGRTSMHVGALLRERADEIIPKLIEQGYGLDVEDNKGNTPLLDAISKKLPVSVDVLLQAGASPNALQSSRSPLVRAVSTSQPIVVKSLIEKGADPNALNFQDGTELPLHHLAAAWDREDDRDESTPANKILQLLVNAGADPDIFLEERNGQKVNVWGLFYTEPGKQKLHRLIAEKVAKEIDMATPSSSHARANRL